MGMIGQYRGMESLRIRVRSGDPDAFGMLFDGCERKVYNYAFRTTGSWSAAEEVVSLTFLEAWRLRGTVHPEGGSLDPWVMSLCVNVTRNISRAQRRHEAVMSRLPPASALPDFADEVASRLDDAARVAAVRQALGALNRLEQEIIGLCVWSGLDYATAAEALGVPVGTVRSRLSRARKKLERLVRYKPLAVPVETEPSGVSGQREDNGQNADLPIEETSDESQSFRS